MTEGWNGGMGEWGRSLRSRSEQWVDYVVNCQLSVVRAPGVGIGE